MSSMNDGINFIYADKSSKSFGVFLVTAFGSITRSGNIENRKINTTKNAMSNKSNFHGVLYEEPLEFDIIIVNHNGTFIDETQERIIKKWLLTPTMNWFQIDQSTLANTKYYCIAKSAEFIDVGAYSGGLKITFVCDTYHAWSNLQKLSFSSITTTNTSLNLNIDFDDYPIYPTLIIKALGSTSVSIKNNTTNQTIIFSGCTLNEEIILECGTYKAKSNIRSNIVSNWNKEILNLVDGKNQLILTGDFIVEFQYRTPIRVGA